MNTYRLWICTADQPGLIFNISRVLLERGFNIEKNNEFVDPSSERFYMRSVIVGDADEVALTGELEAVLPADSRVVLLKKHRKDVVLMVTSEAHCLGDILIHNDSGELDANVRAVISNHATLKKLVERFGIPFSHIPHEDLSREEHEENIVAVLSELEPDLVVLARYMRVLTPAFVARYPQKLLNIHHSFLPAFMGANPYKQAHERGVKIIGATAHFVTNDLDEGPIIAQDVVHVDHSYSWKEMQKAGRHVEKVVLAQALDLVLEDRVLVSGNKTIVF